MKYSVLKLLLALFFLSATNAALLSQNIKVKGLKFEGNEDISTGKLKKAIKTKATPWANAFFFWKEDEIFEEKVFLNDLLRIEKFYHQEGYLKARVTDYEIDKNEAGDEVRLTVHLAEGEPARVTHVDFSPANGIAIPLPEKDLKKLITLKNGKTYREENLRLDYNKFIERFSNLGYPYVEARVKPVVDAANHTVALQWFIDPGPYATFGPISITGNKSVSDKLIRRGLNFKEGRRFEQNRLVASQSQIYRLQLFQYASLRAVDLDKRPTAIPIEVEVSEAKIRTLKLGVGYGSEENLRATMNWTHRNFFGGARILRATIKHSGLLPIDLELELHQPFFLGKKNDLLVKPFFIWQDEKSFEVRRLGFETTVNRQLDKITNAFATVRIERDSVRVKGKAVSRRLEDLYNKSILQFGMRWNATDQLFSPTKGYIAKVVAEEAGLLFRSRFRYYKFFGEYRNYWQVQTGFVFASRLAAGLMNPYGGSAVTPVEERFFAGGSYSVRGWGRQQLGPQILDPATNANIPAGGNSYLEGGVELRYPVYRLITGAIFLDGGNVWEESTDFDVAKLKFSIGLGLRYNTPIGPIRLDFAHKINTQVSDEDPFQIHVSIGQAF